MKLKNSDKGFTLIELMIVIAILAIIVAFAYPAYRDTVLKSRRSDATTGLQACAIAQERYFTKNTKYAAQAIVDANCTGTLTDLCPCKNTNDGYYTLGVVNTDTTFTITATTSSKGVQTDDDDKCNTFTLDQAGVRKAFKSGSSTPVTATCW